LLYRPLQPDKVAPRKPIQDAVGIDDAQMTRSRHPADT
jgi:hypothetical protein